MAPPKFADIGKKVRDLFKKNHDYTSSLKVTKKGSPLAVETDISLPVGGGKTKLTFKKNGVEVEANIATSGKHGLTVTAKDTMPGLELKGDAMKKSISSTYKHATSTHTLACADSLDYSGVYGLADNWNLGVSAALSFEAALKDYGIAIEHTQGDIILSAAMNNSQTFNLGWYQKTCCGKVFGVDMSIGDKQSLRVGGETTFDNLTLRGKMDDKGIVGASLTTVLDPNVKVTMAAQFDIFADDIAPSQVGFAFQLGDY